LIVMLIIMILFTMYWGTSPKGQQKKLKVKCQGNLQKLFISMQIYSTDFAGTFPAVTNALTSEAPLDLLVPRYNADNAMFICPGSKDALPPGESLLKHKISYAYYMGRRASGTVESLLSDCQVDTLAKTNGQLTFSASGNKPGNNHLALGGNFLFTDGHVESVSSFATFPLPLPAGVVLLNPKP